MKSLALIVILATVGGCKLHHIFDQEPQVQGSGRLKTENRAIGAFTRVVAAGAADCRITVGSGPSLSIRGDDNILPLIETKVEKGILTISSKGSYSTQNPLQVTIQVPNLESFTTRGSGESVITGVRGRSFSAEISGSGTISGSGSADRVSLAIRGSGELDFRNLKARDGEANISGSGEIQLYVTGNLNANVRGSGAIYYSGKPDNVQRNVAGSGEIEEK